jgi:fibronectin-binding autotransporter adhesin
MVASSRSSRCLKVLPITAGLMAAMVGLSAGSADAQITWTGTGAAANGDWATVGNWGTAAPPANNFSTPLVFAGSTFLSNTNTLTGGTATGITFSAGAGAFTLNGNAITGTGSITNSSTNLQTIALGMNLLGGNRTLSMTAGGGNLALTGTIGGSGGLSLGGSGTATLSGANTYTGNTTINSGNQTLLINGNTALGSGTFVMSGNGFFDNTSGANRTIANNFLLNGGSPTFNGTGNLSITGTTTLTGAVTRTITTNGTAALTLGIISGTSNFTKSGTGTLVMGAAGNYTGLTTIAAGTLRTTVANAIPVVNAVAFSGSSTLDLQQNQTLASLTFNAGSAGAVVTNSSGTNRTLVINTLTVNDNATVGGTSLALAQSSTVRTLTWTVASGRTLALSSTAAFASNASRSSYLNIVNSGTITSTISQTNGIVGGGWLTMGPLGSNNDWATIASGTLVALGTGGSSYDSIATPGTNRNVLATANGSVASGTWNTIKVAAASSGQALTISSGTLALASGGIIFTGANDYAINGSTLTSRQGTTNSDLIVYQNGTGNLTIASTIGNGNGAQTLTKFGTGLLTLGGSTTYTGTTFLSGGTLAYSTDNPNVSAVQYGIALSDTTASTLDIQGNVTATSLRAGVVATGTSYLNVAAGKNFIVAGNVTIGPASDLAPSGTSFFAAQGSGTFTMSAANATFNVSGGNTNQANGTRVNAIADFTGLSTLVINTGTTGSGAVTLQGPAGTNVVNDSFLYLAPTTVITTPNVFIGNGNGGGQGFMYFGSGTTTINAGAIFVTQTTGVNNRGNGVAGYVVSNTTGSLVVRGVDGVGRSAIFVNNNGSTTNGVLTGTFNVLGHSADLLLSTLSIGNRTSQGNTTAGTVDFFGWDKGALDVSGTAQLLTFVPGNRSYAANGSIATMTLGSTNSTLSDTAVFTGGIAMAINSSTFVGSGTAATGTASLTIGGASITSGPITLGDLRGTGVGATSTATLSITGGKLTMTGPIASGTGGGAGTLTSSLTLNGGTLDMVGFAIGGANATSGSITTLSFQSGTLSNVSGINGTAGLTKTGAGLLAVTGSNTYAGPTAVTSGTLAVNGAILGSGSVSVAAAAWLQGTGTIAGDVNVLGMLSPGNSPGVLTLGSVVLGGSSTTLIEINGLVRGTDYDGASITGTSNSLTYGGLLSLNFGAVSPNDVTYDIFNFTGGYLGNYTTVTSTGAYIGTWTNLGGSGTFQLVSGAQTLTFSPSTGDIIVVPEPAAVALAGIGLGLAGWVARRRIRRAVNRR